MSPWPFPLGDQPDGSFKKKLKPPTKKQSNKQKKKELEEDVGFAPF